MITDARAAVENRCHSAWVAQQRCDFRRRNRDGPPRNRPCRATCSADNRHRCFRERRNVRRRCPTRGPASRTGFHGGFERRGADVSMAALRHRGGRDVLPARPGMPSNRWYAGAAAAAQTIAITTRAFGPRHHGTLFHRNQAGCASTMGGAAIVSPATISRTSSRSSTGVRRSRLRSAPHLRPSRHFFAIGFDLCSPTRTSSMRSPDTCRATAQARRACRSSWRACGRWPPG